MPFAGLRQSGKSWSCGQGRLASSWGGVDKPKETMFPLKRYFAGFGLAGMVIAGTALAFLYRSAAEDMIREAAISRGHEYNLLLIHLIEHHIPTLERQVLISPSQMRSQLDSMDATLKKSLPQLPLLKVRIFTLDGIVAYSTDRAEIGQPTDDHKEFQKSLRGKPDISFIGTREFQRFGVPVHSQYTVETFSPLHNNEGSVSAIAEFYIDISQSFAQFDRHQFRMILQIAASLGLLYAVLFLMVRQADRILKQQHQTIQEEMRDHARMAQALLDSEHRQRLITDALPVLIAYVDRDLCFRFANRTYHDWFGRPPWELAGKRLDEIPELEELARLAVHIGLDVATAQEVCLESRVATQGGRYRDVHATFLPHMTPEGDVLGFFSLVQDVTSQKLAEKTLRRAQGELEAKVAERTLELSQEIAERRLSEARILASQAALKAMYNITSSQEAGFSEKVRDLIEFGTHHFEMQNGVLAHLDGQRFEIQFAISKQSGLIPGHTFSLDEPFLMNSPEPVAVSGEDDGEWQGSACHKLFGFKSFLGARVDVGGQVYGFLAFASPDVRLQGFRPTDREIIRLMAQWIGAEIARLRTDTALRDAKERAEEASKVKSEFLATISHELRTPLNAIIGFSDLMMMKAFGPLGHENYEDYLHSIHDSGQHLLKIINDILDVSKIEAGMLDMHEEVFDLVQAGHEALRLTEHKAQESQLHLSADLPDAPLSLFGDRRRIMQIFLNLLSNAIKFTPAGGKITLSMQVLDDGRVRMSISDTGIGMTLKDIEKALTPFGQVDSKLSRRQEGTGLGLPLTKSLAELHKADFDIISTPWVGTKVIVTFPADRHYAKAP
jgi:PAS domain S-box-containing protein